jgi:hypothetical protein
VDTVDKLKAIVSCVHVKTVNQPVLGHPTPHILVMKPYAIYIAVEEQVVKIVCPDCFIRASTQALYTTHPSA